ncbi:F0F1 ATP synthase subunit A [Leptospira sp. GIMC2001]|nr:F0F1 ATP synthase subunit A [Leptospira sp. GIMC2001]WCL48930.1 F0F1 ATP synthase subunit A [Leptospira sp. GIMC2001]
MNFRLNQILVTIIFSLFLFTNPVVASSTEGEEFDLNGVIVHHLSDAPVFPLNFGGEKVYEGSAGFDPNNSAIFHDSDHKSYHYVGGLDMHITKRVTMMWIGCLILLLIFIPAASKISKNPMKVNGRFANGVEALVGFIKKDVVDGSMHGHGHAYYHYMLTLFFFILSGNLMGIIPPIGEIFTLFSDAGHHHPLALVWSGITTTGDVSVTVSLAIMTFLLIMGTGFAYQGIKFIPHSVPNGVPLALWPLMWPLEFIVSPLAKCFALTVRLLANMTAGHVIILALIGFIFKFQTYYIVPVAIVGAGAIYVLEIFVAFLQAYIFVLLTSIFVGSVMHRH